MRFEGHPYIDSLIISSDITGDRKYYVYVHYRMDKLEPFYVGIGTKFRKGDYDRALNYRSRSKFWKRVVGHTRYKVMIIGESDDYQDIINKEINYIAVIGKRKDKRGTLVNLTDGGEGSKGHNMVWTDEMRAKISKANRERKVSDYTREKLRQLIKTRSFYGKVNYKKVILQLDKFTGEIKREFESSAEAARYYNITPQSINNAVRKSTNCMNSKWVYKDGYKKERTIN